MTPEIQDMFNNLWKYYQMPHAKLYDVKDSLWDLISAAHRFGLNYIFINKGMINDKLIDELKLGGYSVIVWQGDDARIKISWCW